MINQIRTAINHKRIECFEYFGYAPDITVRLSPHGLLMCRLSHEAVLYLREHEEQTVDGVPFVIDTEQVELFTLEYRI